MQDVVSKFSKKGYMRAPPGCRTCYQEKLNWTKTSFKEHSMYGSCCCTATGVPGDGGELNYLALVSFVCTNCWLMSPIYCDFDVTYHHLSCLLLSCDNDVGSLNVVLL
jgi:hypothetical protein